MVNCRRKFIKTLDMVCQSEIWSLILPYIEFQECVRFQVKFGQDVLVQEKILDEFESWKRTISAKIKDIKSVMDSLEAGKYEQLVPDVQLQ